MKITLTEARKTVKNVDGFFASYISSTVSPYLVTASAALNIHPNTLTVFSVLTTLIGIFLYRFNFSSVMPKILLTLRSSILMKAGSSFEFSLMSEKRILRICSRAHPANQAIGCRSFRRLCGPQESRARRLCPKRGKL